MLAKLDVFPCPDSYEHVTLKETNLFKALFSLKAKKEKKKKKRRSNETFLIKDDISDLKRSVRFMLNLESSFFFFSKRSMANPIRGVWCRLYAIPG